MSTQTEMLHIVEVCEQAAALQKQLEREQAAFWGRSIGLLTPEMIAQSNHPDWQWGDYAI